MDRGEQIRLIADRFVEWQTPYGWPDPDRCPHVTRDQRLTSVNFHSPTFMAIALYKAADAVNEPRYKEAADRYVSGYFAALRDPPHQADFYTRTWVKEMERQGSGAEHIIQQALCCVVGHRAVLQSLDVLDECGGLHDELVDGDGHLFGQVHA